MTGFRIMVKGVNISYIKGEKVNQQIKNKKMINKKIMKDSFGCSYDCGCTVDTLKDTLEYWEKELVERQVNAHFATHTVLVLRGLIRDKKA